jgi:multidrug efflux pump
VSGFVALSLSPMMCSKLLKHQGEHNLLYRIIERVLQGSRWLSRAAERRARGRRSFS